MPYSAEKLTCLFHSFVRTSSGKRHRARNQGVATGEYEGLFISNSELEVNNPTLHYDEKTIQSFPLPDRSDFDHAAYQEVWFQKNGSKTTSIMITLGCPFSCDFCSRPVFGNVFRRRNLETVFEEIELIRGLGYDSLWIADDNFTLNLPYLKEFCKHMVEKKISRAVCRVTGISQDLACLMKEAGLPPGLPGSGNGQPGNAATDEQESHS
jgi:anaerobic magnesium-protoporphyrin IX monomethyl ester cyclase